MIPGIAFRALQRDTAVDHQHLAGDVAGVIAEQKFHGVADVPPVPSVFSTEALARWARAAPLMPLPRA